METISLYTDYIFQSICVISFEAVGKSNRLYFLF